MDSSLGSYGMKKPPNISSSHPMKPPLSAGAVLACAVFRVLASRPFVRSVNGGVSPGVLVLVSPVSYSSKAIHAWCAVARSSPAADPSRDLPLPLCDLIASVNAPCTSR